ncbi:MAG TPA: translation initiation factor eIF-2B subunit [Ktedonobacteraceae bacterium]|nr:translation initiation factor eIF-2B subunit [Ktedonobacteraceae bacterium]
MDNIGQRVSTIVNDREHGSRWLVREAIVLLRDIAAHPASSQQETMQQLYTAGEQLAQSRPAMAALAGAVGRILHAANEPDGIAQKADEMLQDYATASERIAAFAQPLLSGTLMTHSISGTVVDVLVACRSQIEQVIALEGRPRYEGRELAKELAKHAIAVTLITDAQADIFLPQCHAFVVGADTVLANGDVLNKAGTALLAWAARGHSVPCYVLCETLKISPHSWTGNLAQLEEKEPDEVLPTPIQGVTVRNFYFDRTPARLVSRVITEQGPMGKADIKKLASSLRGIV